MFFGVSPTLVAAFCVSVAGEQEVMIIGGGAIYSSVFELVDTLYVTEVDAAPDGDTYFPEVDMDVWEKVEESTHVADEDNDHAFVMQKLVRKSPQSL